MLDSFRSLSGGLFAKILLTFLVLTFAIWGIGDMVRTPGRNQTIATVGNVNITSDEFLRAAHRETENLRRALGDNFSPEMLKNANFSHYVLEKLVNHTLMKLETESLGLVPSDNDVVRKIRANPSFQDHKGNFDKAIFEAALKNTNMSEKSYVDQLRQDIAISLLMETLVAVTPKSDMAARTLLQAREEQRQITLYSLSPSLVSNIPQPDAAQIKAYYDQHNHDFTAPEYRTLQYVTISNSDVLKNAPVSDDALRTAYKERMDDFKHPERRAVEQLLYSSQEKAEKAKEMFKGGKTFQQIGAETDVLNKNAISMGKIERNNVIENAADAVFSLPKGEVTDPVQSPFGWHIFHVVSIDAPSVAPFEEVKPMLEKELKQRNADEGLNKLANQIEDALAGGGSLQEVARDFKLKIVSVGTLNRNGETPDGSKATVPALDKFLDTAFKTDEKTESPMTTSKGGQFYIVRVDKVTPERLKPLDEVKAQAVAGWQSEERQKRLAILAGELGKKFTGSAERDSAIEKYNLQPVASPVIKRSSRTAGDISLPPSLVSDVFARKIQQGTEAAPAKSGSYLIAVVDAVIPAAAPDKDSKLTAALAEISHTMENATQNELLEQYTMYLASKYPVSIHDAVLQAVLK